MVPADNRRNTNMVNADNRRNTRNVLWKLDKTLSETLM